MADAELVVRHEIVFRSGAPMNTAVDADVHEVEPGEYEIAVTNPSSVSLSAHVKVHEPQDQAAGGGGSDHWPEVAVFTVEPGTHDERAGWEGEWDLSRGGRVTLTLDEALGVGDGFPASVVVRKPGR